MKMITVLSSIMIFLHGSALAYDDENSHPKISIAAIKNSRTENFLINRLNLKRGLETTVPDSSDRTIQYYLEKGSELEDSPPCRQSNHFHNPLKPWDQSYMSDEPGLVAWWCGSGEYKTRYSNIFWATGFTAQDKEREHRISQRMGWDDARNYFHLALTSTFPNSRDDYFAKTFQALGQVMHLLQDMAVPAHVRNDFESHLQPLGPKWAGITKWFGNLFEDHVKKKLGLIADAKAIPPSFRNSRVTDFWDTTDGEKNNSANDTSLGLAEYVNRKYLSESTLPNHDFKQEHFFTLPEVNKAKFQICEDYEYNSMVKRKYLSRRKADGSCPPISEARSTDHFAAISLLGQKVDITDENIPSLKFELDDNVHNTYAKDLLPLAIGYSAELLNYFFRGISKSVFRMMDFML